MKVFRKLNANSLDYVTSIYEKNNGKKWEKPIVEQ